MLLYLQGALIARSFDCKEHANKSKEQVGSTGLAQDVYACRSDESFQQSQWA